MKRLALGLAVGIVVGWCARWALEPRVSIFGSPQLVAPIASPYRPPAETTTEPPSAGDAKSPTSRSKKPRASASHAPTPESVDVPHSPESMALLVEIEAAAENPDADGRAVLEMARRYFRLQRKPNVPAALVQRLMARGGKFDDAGGLLFGFMAYDEAAREYRGLLAGAPSAAAWGDADHQAKIAAGFFEHFGNFPSQLTDDDVRATLASRDPRLRRFGVQFAADRKLLGWEACLERAKTDADGDVRSEALTAALVAASDDDSAKGVIADEIVAFARSADPTLRATGLLHLEHAGAKGAAIAREVLDQGGADDDLYGAAAACLIAARRFDGLASDSLDDACRTQLVRRLGYALEEDASIRPQVVDVLRALGMPRTADEIGELADVARAADAMDLVFAAAKNASAPIDVRKFAFVRLIDDETTRASGIALLGDVLRDPATTAAHRRAILEEAQTEIVRAGDDGAALLRRVAKDDANPRIRDLAARLLREAGK